MPVVVPDFVSEVPEHRSVWFAQLLSDELPVGIVRFREIERDHPGVVSRDHRAIARGQQLERETVNFVGVSIDNRKSERPQLIHQSTFRSLGSSERFL